MGSRTEATYYCDLCGRADSLDKVVALQGIKYTLETQFFRRMDLCWDCRKGLLDFIEARTEDRDATGW